MENIRLLFLSKLTLLVLLANSLAAHAGEAALRSGDIILRREAGVISDIFARVSGTSGLYSHAGLLLLVNDQVKVVHIEEIGATTALQVEDYGAFLRNSVRFAVYRPQNATSGSVIAAKIAMLGDVKFDYDFAWDNGKLYCTEFVALMLDLRSIRCCRPVLIPDLILNASLVLESESDKSSK